MGLFTWIAASDAESAARGAEYAANQAREETERLADLHSEKVRKRNIEDLNKLFQDIFYNREADYYKVDSIKQFIDKSIGYRSVYRTPYHNYHFPYLFVIIFSITSYLSILGFSNEKYNGFTIFLSIVSFLSFLAILKIHKNWFDWKRNKDEILQNRMNSINNEYLEIIKSLKNEFYMLSDRGIRVKYAIDKHLQNIYKILEQENSTKAKESLLKLYYLIFNIDEKFNSNEENIVTRQFLERQGIKELISKNRLFTTESIEIYKNA